MVLRCFPLAKQNENCLSAQQNMELEVMTNIATSLERNRKFKYYLFARHLCSNFLCLAEVVPDPVRLNQFPFPKNLTHLDLGFSFKFLL